VVSGSGDGITIGYLAAELIAALIADQSSPLPDDVAIAGISPR
jgi:glycine/D-amino acid oxidase-like deaminating enzyme